MKKSSIVIGIVALAVFGWGTHRISSPWVTPTTNLVAPMQTEPGTETPIHTGPGICKNRCQRTG